MGTSTTVPTLDNVSDTTPKDSAPATPQDLATDESFQGRLDGFEAGFIVISDTESGDPVLPIKSATLGVPQKIMENSLDSGSGSENGIVEVPKVLEVISISDSESESEGETRAIEPARVREQSFDSVELKWLHYLGYTRENTPESEVSGVQFERPTRSLMALSSCGLSSSQAYHSCDENVNTNAPSQNTKNHTISDAMKDDDTKTMKKKRSLEQLEAEGVKEPNETEKKRHRDTSQESENKTANVSSN